MKGYFSITLVIISLIIAAIIFSACNSSPVVLANPQINPINDEKTGTPFTSSTVYLSETPTILSVTNTARVVEAEPTETRTPIALSPTPEPGKTETQTIDVSAYTLTINGKEYPLEARTFSDGTQYLSNTTMFPWIMGSNNSVSLDKDGKLVTLSAFDLTPYQAELKGEIVLFINSACKIPVEGYAGKVKICGVQTENNLIIMAIGSTVRILPEATNTPDESTNTGGNKKHEGGPPQFPTPKNGG